MSYSVATYVVRWIFVARKMVRKWRIYLNPLFHRSSNETYITHTYAHAHKHTHTPTIAIGENVTRCISPKSTISTASYSITQNFFCILTTEINTF